MAVRATLLACAVVTAAVLGYYGAPFVVPSADRRSLLPGRTSRGHYLIESACSTCHTPFGGVDDDACLRCHEASLSAAEDTHREGKFRDPRNADRVAVLDARACVTCHREHAPERTREGGVTVPLDFCEACHKDVARERPSHAGLPFSSCASVGCHRFHDNRALYEGFMAEHLREPEERSTPRVPLLPAPTPAPTGKALRDEPVTVRADAALVKAWEGSAHAVAGVSCAACHGVEDATGMIEWRDRPGGASCGRCHAHEEEGFLHSRHGMRQAAGLSPLVPAMARLPMRPEARDTPLGCDACHPAHAYDTRRAAVDACLGCHDDRHSRGYRSSRHFLLWQRETSGDAAPGTGVSCATCHMPRKTQREHGADVVRADHDASDDMRPADRMLRSVCLGCHGLGFAIDALADRELVERNFNGRPSVHVQSLEMVETRRREGGDRR